MKSLHLSGKHPPPSVGSDATLGSTTRGWDRRKKLQGKACRCTYLQPKRPSGAGTSPPASPKCHLLFAVKRECEGERPVLPLPAQKRTLIPAVVPHLIAQDPPLQRTEPRGRRPHPGRKPVLLPSHIPETGFPRRVPLPTPLRHANLTASSNMTACPHFFLLSIRTSSRGFLILSWKFRPVFER